MGQEAVPSKPLDLRQRTLNVLVPGAAPGERNARVRHVPRDREPNSSNRTAPIIVA